MQHTLDDLRPSPSLSTTPSAHCTDRPDEVGAPRRRRMGGAVSPVVVVVVVADCVGAGGWVMVMVWVVLAVVVDAVRCCPDGPAMGWLEAMLGWFFGFGLVLVFLGGG